MWRLGLLLRIFLLFVFLLSLLSFRKDWLLILDLHVVFRVVLFFNWLKRHTWKVYHKLEGLVKALSKEEDFTTIYVFIPLHHAPKLALGHFANFEEAHRMSHRHNSLELIALFIFDLAVFAIILEL